MEFVPATDKCLLAERKLVKGGYEANGSPLYHVVAMHNGIRIPGKVTNHWYILQCIGCCSWLICSLGFNIIYLGIMLGTLLMLTMKSCACK